MAGLEAKNKKLSDHINESRKYDDIISLYRNFIEANPDSVGYEIITQESLNAIKTMCTNQRSEINRLVGENSAKATEIARLSEELARTKDKFKTTHYEVNN